MKVIKKVNNNVAIAMNSNHQEVFLVGKGIGFRPVPYDLEDDSPIIEKVFISMHDHAFLTMFNQIPAEIILLTQKIIDDAQKTIGKNLQPRILFTLSDHLHYTLERYRDNLEIKSLIHWEIKHIYPREYEAAERSVKFINEQLKIELTRSEAALIAVHFVNAQLACEVQGKVSLTDIISDVTAIVKYQFHMDIEQDQINYERFVTHLRLLVERQLTANESLVQNEHLYVTGKSNYPEEAKCVDRIADLLSKNYGIACNIDEKLYLLLHVRRLTQRLSLKKDCY